MTRELRFRLVCVGNFFYWGVRQLVVAGGDGLPVFHKQDPNFLLVNRTRDVGRS